MSLLYVNPSVRGLFEELRDRVELEGVSTLPEYVTLVDDLIQQKEVDGMINADEDVEQIRIDLEGMWPELEEEL